MLPSIFNSRDVSVDTVKHFLRLGGIIKSVENEQHSLYYKNGKYYFDDGYPEYAAGIWDYFNTTQDGITYRVIRPVATKQYNRNLS